MKKTMLILVLSALTTFLAAQTRTELNKSDLQKSIHEYISKSLPGYTIGKSFKVDTKGVITYEICVSKGQNHEKLFFGKDGKYIRQESCTNDCCQVPKKK